MADGEYVPPADTVSDVSSDEDEDLAGGDVTLASGDEEVVAMAVSSSTSLLLLPLRCLRLPLLHLLFLRMAP